MSGFNDVDPTSLVLGAAMQLQLIKKRAHESAKRAADAQAKRERAFGRRLKEEVVCGVRCYPELILECAKLPTRAEAVGAYNEAVARYEGNCDATLSAKQFRKAASELEERSSLNE